MKRILPTLLIIFVLIPNSASVDYFGCMYISIKVGAKTYTLALSTGACAGE